MGNSRPPKLRHVPHPTPSTGLFRTGKQMVLLEDDFLQIVNEDPRIKSGSETRTRLLKHPPGQLLLIPRVQTTSPTASSQINTRECRNRQTTSYINAVPFGTSRPPYTDDARVAITA
ncbi:putative extracellular elastinolytic metalloproteinase precursor [Moniliophthora roreri]|nr:putative extracellular elastinolytic metalloproteinase precursor [Moniliophthora roreri]